jgi:hypothetical protein
MGELLVLVRNYSIGFLASHIKYQKSPATGHIFGMYRVLAARSIINRY